MNSMPAPKIDVSAIRVHHCAKAIELYCRQGRRKDFIWPNWLGCIDPDSIFNCLIGEYRNELFIHEKMDMIRRCLRRWPARYLEEFYPFPVLRMLDKLTAEEIAKVSNILRDYYDF